MEEGSIKIQSSREGETETEKMSDFRIDGAIRGPRRAFSSVVDLIESSGAPVKDKWPGQGHRKRSQCAADASFFPSVSPTFDCPRGSLPAPPAWGKLRFSRREIIRQGRAGCRAATFPFICRAVN